MKLMIGADPELFVRKRQHFLSGHIFECGTKQSPLKTENGSVQVDGIALECNVRPAQSKDEFISNVNSVLNDLRGVVVSRVPDARLVATPSIYFGQKALSKLPPEAAELGCTPDFDAYTGRRNPTPNAGSPLRTGAGHIHIGWTEHETPRKPAFFQQCQTLTKQLDYYLGLPSLLWDTDTRRRRLYGKAGAFRPKPYGLEYRVLSNAWLASDELIGWVYERTVHAINKAFSGCFLDETTPGLAATLINGGDADWPAQYPWLKQEVLS